MLPQLLSFVMVVFGFVLVRNWEQAQLANEFRSRAQAVANAFQSRLDFHVESQKTISGLFSNFGIITREQMQNSVQAILRQHPELMAIEWAALVPDDMRILYETNMSAAFKTEFKIRERFEGQLRDASRRAEYIPITYVAPMAGNEFVLGFDVLSMENRRFAIQQARTTGLTVSTEPLTLVQDQSGKLSCLLVTPAYDELGVNWQPDQLGKFKGVVLTILRPAEVLDSVNVGTYRQDMALKLVDTQFDGSAYLDQITKEKHPYQWDINLNFAGRSLQLSAQPTAIFLSNHIPWVAWISLGGGMLFCGVIGMYLLMMSGRSFGIESLVQRRTLELQESKWSLQSILDNAADGILTVNANGQIALANRAAEHLLNEQNGQLEGKYVDRLFIDANNQTFAIQDVHITAFDEVLIAKEMRYVYADGSEISLELAISKVQRDAQPFFILILHDLTERKRADKIKGEFVSAVSHELRTPLTSIRGTLGLVVAGALGEVPEKAMKMLQLANNNAERLHTLINDLLDFEKLEFGGMLFKLAPCRLDDILRKSIEYNLAYAEKFSVRLQLQIPDALQEIKANVDESRLIQVLSNLISNAIKFSPSGSGVKSEVIIRVEQRDSFVRVLVEDKGIGISDEFRERIFSKFSQADGSGTRKYAGTGLGLSLAKAMVEKMQGSIGFESVFGEGSSFYVEFPISDT
jgi:PAS domain S-box-containing protein